MYYLSKFVMNECKTECLPNTDRSIVGVTDDPTLGLDLTGRAGEDHALTEEHLSGLIVEDDDHEEGDGRKGEMGERNHSGSETGVDPLEVAEEEAEKSLGEEGLVHVSVDHTLLGDGEVSGLANEKIRPLDAHDGDEVTTLSVVESLNGVADLVLGDVRVLEEVRCFTVITPTALRPFGGLAVGEVQTDIDGGLTGSKHINSLVLASIGTSHSVTTGGEVVSGVDVGISRHVTLLGGESEKNTWSVAVIVHDVEVGEETGSSLDNTNLEVSEGDKFGVDKMISVRLSWGTIHDIELGVLVSEGNGGVHIGTEINAENEDGRERLGDLEDHEEEEGGDLGDVG